MPTSHWMQLNEIIAAIKSIDPRSMLDVGVGFGKFGVLAREYLEFWDGRNQYDDWVRRIDGVESFFKYKNPIHDFAYNKIVYCDATDALHELQDNYDLAILIDVLEHFTREQGLALLNDYKIICRNFLISVPHRVSNQGAAFGNEYETHRFEWKIQDIPKIGNRILIPNSQSLICLMGKDVGTQTITKLSSLNPMFV